MFLKTYNTGFDKIFIKFTDQNGRFLGTENSQINLKVNMTLLINK